MRHYKKYSKRLTKREKQKRFQIALLIALMVCSAVIGFTSQLQAYEEQEYKAIGRLEIWPEQTPIKDYVLKEVYKAGINPDEADKIIQCESQWKPDAHMVNWNNKLGVDRGLFQINSLFHKEVSNACAYDYKCAVKEAIRIYKERGNWSAWSCNKIVLASN